MFRGKTFLANFYCFLSLYLHNKFINSKYVGIYHWIWCALVEVFPENIETKSGYCTWRFPLKHDMSFLVLSLKVVENCPENKTETRSINNMRITPSRFPLYIIDRYSHAFFREINDKFHLPKRLGQKNCQTLEKYILNFTRSIQLYDTIQLYNLPSVLLSMAWFDLIPTWADKVVLI